MVQCTRDNCLHAEVLMSSGSGVHVLTWVRLQWEGRAVLRHCLRLASLGLVGAAALPVLHHSRKVSNSNFDPKITGTAVDESLKYIGLGLLLLILFL